MGGDYISRLPLKRKKGFLAVNWTSTVCKPTVILLMKICVNCWYLQSYKNRSFMSIFLIKKKRVKVLFRLLRIL